MSGVDEILKDPEARRVYQEELLFGEATANIDGILESLNIPRSELADRMGISRGRVSQMLSGERNLTLRTLAAMAWALGYEFDIRLRSMADRAGTPAENDPEPPDWVRRAYELHSQSIETMDL